MRFEKFTLSVLSRIPLPQRVEALYEVNKDTQRLRLQLIRNYVTDEFLLANRSFNDLKIDFIIITGDIPSVDHKPSPQFTSSYERLAPFVKL